MPNPPRLGRARLRSVPRRGEAARGRREQVEDAADGGGPVGLGGDEGAVNGGEAEPCDFVDLSVLGIEFECEVDPLAELRQGESANAVDDGLTS